MHIMSNKSKKLKFETIEQAELEVLKQVNNGTNYRDISQTVFLIGKNEKRFSISQISKIKQKFSNEDNPKGSESKLDPKTKAKLFKLFKNKMSVVEVVIKTKLDSNLIYEAFKEFTKLSGMCIVDKKNLEDVTKKLYKLDKKHGYDCGLYETPDEVLVSARDYLAS